jgi:hypothetical protein
MGLIILTTNQSIGETIFFFSFFVELTGKLPRDAQLEGKRKGKCFGRKSTVTENKISTKREIQSRGFGWFNKTFSLMI